MIGLTGIDALEAEMRDRLKAKNVEIERLQAENAVLREHVAAIHNEHRHKLSAAMDEFFQASAGSLVLRRANTARDGVL